MSTVHDIKLGPPLDLPDTKTREGHVQQGRSPHGRWRAGYRRGDAPLAGGDSTPVVLIVRQDAERLAFAMTEGPAADILAERLADHLWMTESSNGGWPENLRDWLDDTSQWPDAPPGLTGFICGRIERGIPGGRVYLAWLGMSGVRLLNRADVPVELDTVIGPDEGWTRDRGPEPEGMALHAYRGSLFGLERLIVLTTAAHALFDDLPDMSNSELQRAFDDWGADSEHDLAIFDLRLHPVLNEPNSIVVDYTWITSDQVQLSWRPSPNATAYRVEDAPTPEFDDATILAELTDGRQSSYQLSPPTDQPRYYRVIPLNQGVAGAPSEPVCPTPILLNAPIINSVQWADDGGYLLRWTPMPQATSFEVQSSFDPEFQGHDNQIIYRGDLPETFLSHTTPPGQYYRVRALNALYAPRMPSPWSEPVRSPLRLPAPVFSRVTQQRIEWEPVRGAQHYIVRVTTSDESGADHIEEVMMRDTGCVVAEQRAVYHVRAFRRPEDERTASEWSEGVTLSPKAGTGSAFALQRVSGLLWGVGIAAVLVGIALGWAGLEVYHNYNATSTPTRLPQEVLDVTQAAGTQSAQNATAIQRTGEFIFGQTETAALWTATPTPTATPNATLTVQAEFASRLTATAGAFTATPTPIDPADLTATFAAGFTSNLEATQASWTATPTPTATPNATLTVQAEFASRLTATAGAFTATPTPIDPADLTATFEAAFATEFATDMEATETLWTATPTPLDPADLTATFNAAYAAVFEADMAATHASWTATPTPDVIGTAYAENQANLKGTAGAMKLFMTATAVQWTPTPTVDMPQTVEAGLAATMDAWTETPTPTQTLTPTITPYIEQTFAAQLTATSEAWTATPNIVSTARAVAVAEAGLPPGCYIYNLTGQALPVYAARNEESEQLLPTVPHLAEVIRRVAGPVLPGVPSPVWLEIVLPAVEPTAAGDASLTPESAPTTGWVMVAAGQNENLIYGGLCQSIQTE